MGTGSALAIIGLVALSLARPAEATGPSALSGLQSWLDGTRTLSGRFEQSLVSGALGTGVKERGRIWVARPGKLRWDYLDPEKKVAIVDGERARLWIEADRQMWEGPIDASSAVVSVLLSGHQRLDRLFLAEAVDSTNDHVRVRLRPRGNEAGVEDLVLTLDPKTGAISEAEVLDPSGNRMHFRFWALKRNGEISESMFRFEPPPGTEIVGRP